VCDDAQLTVKLVDNLYAAPEFIQRLRGYNEATAGESVSFVVQFKAFPAPTVKWFKDEEEVRDTERHLLESSSSTHDGTIRLIINDVRSSDEGAYKCKVENQEGVASTTGYLSVIGIHVYSCR
jgi:Immunoglobulin I-set domain